MNDPFAKDETGRESLTSPIPVSKFKAGFDATQEPHEWINQVLFQNVTDHVWGTQTQVTNGDATFYTDGSGNPLDKNDDAVTINEDDKILIIHDVAATGAILLDCGGSKVRIEMKQGVNMNMDSFDLDLGVTVGDSFSGDIELTGTGTLTVLESNGLRIHHTAMTVVITSGDVVVNNSLLEMGDLNANSVSGSMVASSAEIDTGSDDTKIITPSGLNGSNVIAKAWVHFNGIGTVAIVDSYNVSSITDNATGDYTVNFSTSFANANYMGVGSAGFTSGANPPGNLMFNRVNSGGAESAPTSSAMRVNINNLASAIIESKYVYCTFFGDQ